MGNEQSGKATVTNLNSADIWRIINELPPISTPIILTVCITWHQTGDNANYLWDKTSSIEPSIYSLLADDTTGKLKVGRYTAVTILGMRGWKVVGATEARSEDKVSITQTGFIILQKESTTLPGPVCRPGPDAPPPYCPTPGGSAS